MQHWGGSYTALADDNIPIKLSTCADRPVAITPALIKEGRKLFKEETFNGNGRTCETCHRENHNFTIDPEYIAKLPKHDPLFVAENNPDLHNLEDPVMMRKFGLILANSDGFDKSGVLRSAPHLLGLSQTIAIGVREFDNIDDLIGHPVHETGWSADGAPGDGSLRCFPAGSIKQHFTKSMNRDEGHDFRLPTEHELDALLAYQLSLGRQNTPQVSSLSFREPAADRGKTLFFSNIPASNGQTNNCSQCHTEAGANNGKTFQARNSVTNANLSPNAPVCRGLAINPPLAIPADGGFGRVKYLDNISCATQDISVTLYSEQVQNPHGFFNTPSLYEAADTAPYFHNNSAETLEDAIKFYSSDVFGAANGQAFIFGPTDVNDIGAFLRAINAIENARSAIDNVNKALAASGKKIDNDSLEAALADTKDGIKVLTKGPLPRLFPKAVKLFRDANHLLRLAMIFRNRDVANYAKTKLAAVSSQIAQ
ncbi:MAG: DUF1924 domain-containing protein [Methylococcaceae bacterium]